MLPEAIRGLIQATSSSRVVWVLGAGSSVPLVPSGPRLAAMIGRAAGEEILGFPVVPFVHSELRERWLGPPRPSMWSLVTDQAMRVLLAEKLRAVTIDSPVPQRQIFELLPQSHVILDFNVDRLSLAVRWQRVISVHGVIPETAVGDLPLWQILDLAQDDFAVAPCSFWYPETEWPSSALSRNLSTVAEALCWADVVVFVGYSFGGLPSADFLDGVSFNVFTNCLRDRSLTIFVIDPAAIELSGLLAEVWRIRSVRPVAAYWNYLTSALIFSVSAGRGRRLTDVIGAERAVLRVYERG
jgi:hypothetical protein